MATNVRGVNTVRRLAAFILFLHFCWTGYAAADAAKPQRPRMTLMIYMTGSNLESEGGAASAELAEMCAAYADAAGAYHRATTAHGTGTIIPLNTAKELDKM